MDIKKWTRFLFFIGLIFLMAFNISVVLKGSVFFEEDQRAVEMMIRVNHVQNKLDALEAEIWNIVYQPSTSREVLNGRSKAYQKILRGIRMDLSAAQAFSSKGKPHEQLELVKRSVDSLTRKADRLRAQLALQSLDIASTKVFFQDTDKTSMLAESHVVEMEEIMRKINDNVDVVNDNISQYARAEALVLAEINRNALVKYHRWVMIMVFVNAGFLLAAGWFWGYEGRRT